MRHRACFWRAPPGERKRAYPGLSGRQVRACRTQNMVAAADYAIFTDAYGPFEGYWIVYDKCRSRT